MTDIPALLALTDFLFKGRQEYYETDFYNKRMLTGFAPDYADAIAQLLNAMPAVLAELQAARDENARLRDALRRSYRRYSKDEVRACWERGEQLETATDTWERASVDRATKLPGEQPEEHMRWQSDQGGGWYSLITSAKLANELLRGAE